MPAPTRRLLETAVRRQELRGAAEPRYPRDVLRKLLGRIRRRKEPRDPAEDERSRRQAQIERAKVEAQAAEHHARADSPSQLGPW